MKPSNFIFKGCTELKTCATNLFFYWYQVCYDVKLKKNYEGKALFQGWFPNWCHALKFKNDTASPDYVLQGVMSKAIPEAYFQKFIICFILLDFLKKKSYIMTTHSHGGKNAGVYVCSWATDSKFSKKSRRAMQKTAWGVKIDF